MAAILGTTIVALLIAGAGTLFVSTLRDRQQARTQLVAEVKDIADGLAQQSTSTALQDRPALRAAVVTSLRNVLKVSDIAIVEVAQNGRINGTLPAPLTAADLGSDRIVPGTSVSGRRGRYVFAIAPTNVRITRATGRTVDVVEAVVATRLVKTDTRVARYFALSALITVALSALVATTLARRLARPVRDADAAAHRIAAGELSTRLPEPPAGDQDELADLARSINTMAANLERSQAIEQQFLLSISHDLRTPLTSIRGYAEAIKDGATRDPQWAAGVILSESRRLERLVRDLLELGKLQARSFSLSPERFDLSAAAVSALEGAAPDAAQAGVRLVGQWAAAVPVVGDRDRLGQVLANLVENAMKYAASSVVVGTALQGAAAVVWVDDDGPGIAADDRPHVFERLYVTTREPRRREIGSGLGLAIVHELVAAMGGTVTAEAAPSGGARMVVRLPAG